MALSEDDLTRSLRCLVWEGLIGDYEGKAVVSDMIKQDHATITFISSLYDLDTGDIGDKYLICLAKDDGKLISITHVTITKDGIRKAFAETNLGTPDQITSTESSMWYNSDITETLTR